MTKYFAFAAAFLLALPAFAVRTALPVTFASHAGTTISLSGCDLVNGNAFLNNGPTVLLVRNTGASPVTLTIRTNDIVDGDLIVPNRTVSIPVSTAASPIEMLGTFLTDIYNQIDGTVFLDCSAALSIAVLAIQ